MKEFIAIFRIQVGLTNIFFDVAREEVLALLAVKFRSFASDDRLGLEQLA